MKAVWLFITACIGLIYVNPAQAQLAFGDSGETIYIKAEKATYKGSTTFLEGNVNVRQDEARIQSDEMEIFREKTGDETSVGLSLGAVTQIVAIGNFVYTTPDQVVRGNRGVYNKEAATIIVTGNVSVGQPGKSRLSGERLVYDLNTKRVRIGEKGERVDFSID